ncbi:MAG TPA: FliH/SctL family protein [Acidobacteriota bacterium]|nr:FliH/SctL family protein [Acidobacteriota bacterium]
MSARLADPDKVQAFSFRSVDGAESPQVPDFLKKSGGTSDSARPADGSAPQGQSKGGDASQPSGQRDLHEVEREAYEKGFSAGERAGMQMAEKKTEAVLRRFADSLQKVSRLRDQLLGQCEKDLVALSLEVARRLVHREIEIDEKIIGTFVRVALEKLHVNSRVTIYLHPADRDVLSRNLDEFFADRQDIEITLRSRNDLNRGDCQIESEYGNIDGRISEQFREIETGLLGNL